MNWNRRVVSVGSMLLFGLALCVARPSWAVDEIDRIRQKCEEFFMSLAKNEYDLYSRGKEPQYARAHNDFNYLFKQKKIELLRQRAASTGDPDEARAMNLLAVALGHSAVRSYAAPDIDQMYDFMMTAMVSFDGQEIKFGEVRRVIASENDRDRRRQIYIAFNTPLEPLRAFKSGVLSKMQEHLGEWGFESYLQMMSQLRELDLAALEVQAKQFLEATDTVYTAELTRLLDERLDVELRRARGYDIPYVIRGSWLDGNLLAQNAESSVKTTLGGMGLRAEAAKLEMKTQQFCGESIMPRVFALRIPDEIKMCYSAIGGASDMAAHLYMRGKAEYIASIEQPRYFELGRLGGHGLYEASGLLFEGLMADPAWLTKVAGLDPELAQAVARHRAFVALYEGRKNCVSTLMQLGVYSGSADAEKLYSELLGAHMKWDPVLDGSRAALEMNDLESAAVLEGYFLAAQLRGTLESKFGEEWFTSPEAGAYLKSLWKPGQGRTAAAAASELGYDGISPSMFVADLTQAIETR